MLRGSIVLSMFIELNRGKHEYIQMREGVGGQFPRKRIMIPNNLVQVKFKKFLFLCAHTKTHFFFIKHISSRYSTDTCRETLLSTGNLVPDSICVT